MGFGAKELLRDGRSEGGASSEILATYYELDRSVHFLG